MKMTIEVDCTPEEARRFMGLPDVSARNDHSEYGGKTTGALGYGYEFTQDLRATASYGTSFRAPTFNELYYPGYGLTSNKPERGRNAEVGVQYRVAGVDLQMVSGGPGEENNGLGTWTREHGYVYHELEAI